MKIYVVIGSTGEYSDRKEWVARAFVHEDDAKAAVVEYEAAAKEIDARCSLPEENEAHLDRSIYEFGQNGWPHPDPAFKRDYTGTSYFYVTTELVP